MTDKIKKYGEMHDVLIAILSSDRKSINRTMIPMALDDRDIHLLDRLNDCMTYCMTYGDELRISYKKYDQEMHDSNEYEKKYPSNHFIDKKFDDFLIETDEFKGELE